MIFYKQGMLRGERRRDNVRRSTIVAAISFLTLVDLFGVQALLPQLVDAFQVEQQVMGIAVNASTLGMAISGLAVAWFADRIDRKRGVWVCLALLSIPTFLLGIVQTVPQFVFLRVVQGVFMAAAFTLTLTYLSEQCDVAAAGAAMAAYITGNVAANLFGRWITVAASDSFGITTSFFTLGALNLLGAAVALVLVGWRDAVPPVRTGSPLKSWKSHLSSSALRASFMIGFAILFVFVGVFTYVNLHLTQEFALTTRELGLVYLVFLPALVTTLFASKAVLKFGPHLVLRYSALVCLLGTYATVFSNLWLILLGLAVIGASTFFMQAAATGFVGRTATFGHAAANGMYLTSYYIGGLAGAIVLGQVYALLGWIPVALTVFLVVAAIGLLATKLRASGSTVLSYETNKAKRTNVKSGSTDPSL